MRILQTSLLAVAVSLGAVCDAQQTPSLKYESGVVLAEGDYVILHGRFSNIGLPVNWIAADVVRLKDGILVEHWDVIQDEATEQQSKSGRPMFGDSFPK
jgi:predicted SnoaL-like aldol condensation-catalyzing enzyme